MLAKQNRLNKEKDFKRLLQKGKSHFAGIFILKFRENNLAESRFGFIISNKVSKKATMRNLAKRRFREILRQELPMIRNGFDILFIASPKIINEKGKVIKYKELQELVMASLKKTKLLV